MTVLEYIWAGIMAVFMNLGFAVGPPVLAWFADTQGTYYNGFILYAVIALVAAAFLLPIRPRYWEPPAKKAKLTGEPVSATG